MQLLLYSFPLIFCISLFTESNLLGFEKDLPKKEASFLLGNCFLQPLSKKDSPPTFLKLNQEINEELPFALGTSDESLLEIKLSDISKYGIIRIGNDTALEFREGDSLTLHKGSLLVSHRQTWGWNFALEGDFIELNGSGTWMMERLNSAIKIILLEGELVTGNSPDRRTLSSGDLIIISETTPQGSNPIKVDLPLLLGTSRLLNNFPTQLPSKSRLFSAAQVQALRTKRRYDAFIGDVTKEKKLQLWKVPQKQ